jgi:hypothetical protein
MTERKKNKLALAKKKRGLHLSGKCGNNGCTKCFPIKFSAFIDKKTNLPKGMPQWMFIKWKN